MLQTDKQTQQYQQAKNKLRNQWENIEGMNAHGAAHYGTYVFKPANLLSSLDEGVSSVTGNVLRVEGHVQNEIIHSEASQMQFVSKFGKLKSSLLLQYILPLLLIFIAFHSVSSEKQSGRIKLLVLQGAKPAALIWAKTLSVWLYGMMLLSLTVIVYALFNLSNVNAEIANRIFFFYLSYGLFYFIISSLTIFFSARYKNATVALTSMLGIWIIWTIFLPNILMSSVEKWHEFPSRNDFQAAMKEDRAQGIDGHNPSDERAKELEAQILAKYGVDSLWQLPINFDGIRMQADEEYGNQVWDKHFGSLSTILARQKHSYQLAGIFNPFICLQNASMGFAASDNYHHQDFLVQVENYRRNLIKALNDEHAFGGSKTGDWSWEPDSNFYRSVPDYKYQPVALASVLPKYQLDLFLLLAWTILAILFLVFATKKIQII
jgi:ABC-2 type transport system permease protein